MNELQKRIKETKDELLRLEQIKREDQSQNGVRVIVYRTPDGSTVDASCNCLGFPNRVHSDPNCPNRPKD